MNSLTSIGLFLQTGLVLTAAPVISSFSPNHGAPGTQVTLTGAGLLTATKVEFDDVLADFKVVNDAQILAVVPSTATSGQLRVTTPAGAATSSGIFRAAPRISDFMPTRSAPNMEVSINGFNFNGVTHVQFNGSNAAFSVIGETQIRAVVPAGGADGPIRVTTDAGTVLSTSDFVVTGPGPIIDSFSVAFGAPGAEIRIYGVNFVDVTKVEFNGAPVTNGSVPAETQIIVEVPGNASTGRVKVTTAAGSGTSTNDFTVTCAPVITGFAPTFGVAGDTVHTITIYGINFDTFISPGVWFNTQQVTSSPGTPTPDQIIVSVPYGASTGPIWVYNACGYGASYSNFVVTTAPIVERFEPWLGPPGTQVRIYGQNLNTVGAVTFNGMAGTDVSATAQNQATAYVPQGASTGPLRVYNSGGSFLTVSNFVVTPYFPYITRFEPDGGPRGTQVEIYGLNFGPTPTVRFNGVIDPTAMVVTQPIGEKITAHVPAGASTGRITVSSASGTSTNTLTFYVPPWLNSFTPEQGFVGDHVTLTGTNFNGATEVYFGETSAPFAVAPGQLDATVPVEARSSALTVVTPGGLITSTNAYQVLPRITNFTPELGATGAVITVLGTSLSEASAVYFNGVGASFTKVSSTEVTAVVPGTASTGPIRVDTPSGTAVTTNLFLVVGSSDVVLSNTAAPALTSPGKSGTYTLSVSNRGPWTVSSVVVTGQLPTGMTVLSLQTDQGSCVESNGWLICDLGYLTNRAHANIQFSGPMLAEGYAAFAATVNAQQTDETLANNTATAAIVVTRDESRALQIVQSPDNPAVVISWAQTGNPFQLQATSNPLATNSWVSVTNVPTLVGGRNTVTNNLTGQARFYRLMIP